MYFGNVCQTALPSLARSAVGRPSQPSPDLKPLLPFRMLRGFSEMDHIHKALIGPAFGLVTPLKRKPSSCGVCRLRFNSDTQASSHYSGTKHAKRLKTLDAVDSKIGTFDTVAKETTSQSISSTCPQLSSADSASGDGNVPAAAPSVSELAPSSSSPAAAAAEMPDADSLPSLCPRTERETDGDGEVVEVEKETEEEKAVRLLYCSLCKVAVNSTSQLQAHNSGTKHKTMLEARSGDGAIKSFPRSGVKAKLAPLSSEPLTGLQNKTFHCEICDVHVNSETQLKQHISSRRHKDRASGKPAKPKFSPYPPVQRHQSLQAVRLALRKELDLTKPLASCLLQRQLSVAAAAAMATLPPFHLRPASSPNPVLFQTQPLPQALLHPAPGPLCSTHTPVLFSPY